MLDTVTDGVLTINAEGIVLTYNPACERMFGYSPTEIIGKERQHPDALSCAGGTRFLHSSIPSNARSPRNRQRARSFGPSEKRNDLSDESRDRRNEGRGELCFVGIVRDLTTKKAAEGEVRRLERQLFESQKLESLGTLAGGIAHDFNNLPCSILANVDLALVSWKMRRRPVALPTTLRDPAIFALPQGGLQS